MITYIDSSVLLRLVLGQPNVLKEWKSIKKGVASALIEVECLRTLDRLRVAEALPDEEMALRRETVFRLIDALEIVETSRSVLVRASQPLPTTLGTLDAIHLATALLWQQETGIDLVMATHDQALGTAAKAEGMRVIGV